MPDAKRFKPVPVDSPQSDGDPRRALAQQYLQRAAAELAEKEAAQPRRMRSRSGRGPRAFSISIAPATFVHILLASLAFTLGAMALLLCYHMLMLEFTAGRVIALPTGMLVAAALSYVSVLYLGIIESTSAGHTDVEILRGDWQEWFWTLPSTLGMFAITAFGGWLVSLAIPLNVWALIALCVLLFYPIVQLSSLETGSPLLPLSLPVVLSLGRHPFAWFMIYGISFAIVNVLYAVGQMSWHDPPYPTVLVLGPLVSVALFFYAWLLGQLASLISSDKEKS